MPEPTPDDGICTTPRAEKPSEVIVTTESRTFATTAERSASAAAVAVDPAAAAAATGGVAVADASRSNDIGPATSAAVPATARTADRTAAATIEPVRRPDPGRSRSVAADAVDGSQAGPVG